MSVVLKEHDPPRSALYAANSALDIKPSLLASYSSNVLLVKPELPLELPLEPEPPLEPDPPLELPLELLLPHSPCDLTRGSPGVPLTAET